MQTCRWSNNCMLTPVYLSNDDNPCIWSVAILHMQISIIIRYFKNQTYKYWLEPATQIIVCMMFDQELFGEVKYQGRVICYIPLPCACKSKTHAWKQNFLYVSSCAVCCRFVHEWHSQSQRTYWRDVRYLQKQNWVLGLHLHMLWEISLCIHHHCICFSN